MRLSEFNTCCESLPSVTKVIQWGGAHVWKVGGKIFAIASRWGPNSNFKIVPEEGARISFKCSDFSYSILIEQQGIIPAPYLARAKWVQLEEMDAMSNEEVCAYITEAHAIITAKLTKKLRAELGL